MSFVCLSAFTHSHPGRSVHIDDGVIDAKIYRRAAKSVPSAALQCSYRQSILIKSGPRHVIGAPLPRVHRVDATSCRQQRGVLHDWRQGLTSKSGP